MMEHWVVYDQATGEDRWRGSGTAGSAALQPLADGLAIALVPQAVIAGVDIDLAALRVAVAAGIDAAAEQVRQRFLTPGAGQAMTYTRKESEARAYLADSNVAVPFLFAEAHARDMTVDELAAEVVQLADAWVVAGSAIEATRMGAKVAVAAAANIGAIIAAGHVDWRAIGA